MIRSLRKKFVLVAMGSIFVVLTVIIGTILISNYTKIVKRADELLTILEENDGSFPQNAMGGGMHENDTLPRRFNTSIEENKEKKFPQFSPETPFETRFFSVELSQNGEVSKTELGNIAAIEESQAKEYAQAIWKGGRERGFYKSYRYKRLESADQTIMLYFVDCSRDLETYQSFFITSIAVSLLGLVLVFLLVFFSSRLVFQPVAESYDKQKQFITDASHELKTPLTIIDANTEVMEMMEGESEWTISTRKQVKRLASLTQQMVTLSRMDEGTDIGEREKFCISDTVADVAESFVPLAESKGKELSLMIEKGVVYFGWEDLIRQLVSILLDNAIKYSTLHGRILLSLSRKGKRIQLLVTNPVENMETGNQNILFERFYRRDQSRNSQTGGSGIGLSIAKAIVDEHKGKITANSPEGKSLDVTTIL